MKEAKAQKKLVDADEEEEIVSNLGGSEPLTGHFNVGSEATNSNEEDDASNDDLIRLSFPLFSLQLCALILCRICWFFFLLERGELTHYWFV